MKSGWRLVVGWRLRGCVPMLLGMLGGCLIEWMYGRLLGVWMAEWTVAECLLEG